MKINLITILSLCFVLNCVCHASDTRLVSLFSQEQTFEKVLPLLEGANNRDEIDPQSSFDIKPFVESGQEFNGRVLFEDNNVKSVFLWTVSARLPPNEARAVFTRLLTTFTSSMGESTLVENIPNYEDASEVRMDAHLWDVKGDIIVLMIAEYPSRAGISITRQNRIEWLESMGADSGKFWEATLKSIDFTSLPDATTNINQDSGNPRSVPNYQSNTPNISQDISSNSSNDVTNKAASPRSALFWILVIGMSVVIIVIVTIIAKRKH